MNSYPFSAKDATFIIAWGVPQAGMKARFQR
jgi:hypothetical protein